MIIDNSCLGLANTQDEKFTPFWLSRSKEMTVGIWSRDYNPPRCFQKKISGRGKHDEQSTVFF
jgi:ABC-type oligopeptide transport system substrate-binding subunit